MNGIDVLVVVLVTAFLLVIIAYSYIIPFLRKKGIIKQRKRKLSSKGKAFVAEYRAKNKKID